MHRLTEKMSQHEDYDVIDSSHKAGLPLPEITPQSLFSRQSSTKLPPLLTHEHREHPCHADPWPPSAGHPASRVPGMLREIVVVSMTQLEAVIEAAERADTDDFFFNPIGDPLLSKSITLVVVKR